MWWLALLWLIAEFFPRRLFALMGLDPYNWFTNAERRIPKSIFMVVTFTAWYFAAGIFFTGYAWPQMLLDRNFLLLSIGIFAAAYLGLIAYLLSGRDRYDIFTNSILLRIVNMRKNLFLIFLITFSLVLTLRSAYLVFPSVFMGLVVASSLYKLLAVAYYPSRYFDAVRHYIVTTSRTTLASMQREVGKRRQLLDIPEDASALRLKSFELRTPRNGYLTNKQAYVLQEMATKEDPGAVLSLKVPYPFTLIRRDEVIATIYLSTGFRPAAKLLAKLKAHCLIARDIPKELTWLYDVTIMLQQQIRDAERNNDNKLAIYALLLSENLLEELEPYAQTKEPAFRSWQRQLKALRKTSEAML